MIKSHFEFAIDTLTSGKELIVQALEVLDKNTLNENVDTKLHHLFLEISLSLIQTTSLDEMENENCLELIEPLQKRFNTVWTILHLNFLRKLNWRRMDCDDSFSTLDGFIRSLLSIKLEPEVRKQVVHILLKQNQEIYKEHPLYESINSLLCQDSSQISLFVEEIYVPFFFICHYLQDLHILQNDFGSLLKLRSMTESLFNRIHFYKKIFLKEPIIKRRDSSIEPAEISDKVAEELDDLFQLRFTQSTTRLQLKSEDFNDRSFEVPNLLPFNRMISFFSKVPIALVFKSVKDQGDVPSPIIRDLLVGFIIHMSQKEFTVCFITLLSERLDILCSLMNNGQQKSVISPYSDCEFSNLSKILKKHLSIDSRVKTSRFKSYVQSFLEFLRSEFDVLSKSVISDQSGLGDLDNMSKKKREKQLFGKAPDKMLTLSFFSDIDVKQSPYFPQLLEFNSDFNTYAGKKENADRVSQSEELMREPFSTIEALIEPCLLGIIPGQSEDEKDAEMRTEKEKSPKTIILQTSDFFARIKKRNQFICTEISKEREDSKKFMFGELCS